ncbi:secreted Ly-6/uPAR-related protein 1-like [Lithobates pipiens]
MKVLISCLLAAALFLVPASTQNRTECYFCYDPTEVQYCNEIKTCPMNFTYCKTVTSSPNMGFPYETSTLMVTRDCAKQCSDSDSEDLGSETELYCCEGSLCNNKYGVASKASNHRGASTYHLQSGAYGGLIMVFSLFVVLFPSRV